MTLYFPLEAVIVNSLNILRYIVYLAPLYHWNLSSRQCGQFPPPPWRAPSDLRWKTSIKPAAV